MFSQYFGDDPPRCVKQCDYCRDRKATEAKVQAFANSDLQTMPSMKDLDGDDSDLYGGGRRGIERYNIKRFLDTYLECGPSFPCTVYSTYCRHH